MQGATFAAGDLATCLAIPADGGTYVVVPQFAAADTSGSLASYQIGAGGAQASLAAAVSPLRVEATGAPRPIRLQRSFDHVLRERDRRLVRRLATTAAGVGGARASVSAAYAPPPTGTTRTFFVCGNLACDDSAFRTDTATLEFVGNHILFYLSDRAPPPPAGMTAAQLAALGGLIDRTLYDIDVQTFGPPSDIDGNGRVMILMSPYVNALSPPLECQSQGFVAGFFYGADLLPTVTHSNAGEIYYSIAPDPYAMFSCAHGVEDVGRLTGPTFLHELLHMINFNQKVLIHRLGDTEAEFLDEGMAKLAEELGSRYYEQRYPPPTGRTNPDQIFPDSAEAFIVEDLFDSYDFLAAPAPSTATLSVGASTLDDAGAEWLFLRWLGDQKDSTIYGSIVQSALTGIPNIEAAAGQAFPVLFGEFGTAVYTDSLPGVAREQVPAGYRFTSRNLRVLYQALYRAVNDPTQVPRPFPIAPATLSSSGIQSGAMRRGSSAFYELRAPTSGAPLRLIFTAPGGAAFAPGLGAQVSVFRCPSPQACP